MSNSLLDKTASSNVNFDLNLTYFKKILNSLSVGILNFDSFVAPLNYYTDQITNSISSASEIPDNSIYLPSISFHAHSASQDNEYFEFIKTVQKRKMKELWDNDEDEEWEYV